jgi:hypothetical protein
MEKKTQFMLPLTYYGQYCLDKYDNLKWRFLKKYYFKLFHFQLSKRFLRMIFLQSHIKFFSFSKNVELKWGLQQKFFDQNLRYNIAVDVLK